jgi:hypothetical protein
MKTRLTLAVAVVLLCLVVAGCYKSDREPSMAAEVKYDGVQFHIWNRNKVAIKEVRIIVNDKYSGYIGTMEPDEEWTIGANALADGDGNRFNRETMKPLRVKVTSTVGVWSGEWK